ncbi:hypothetical protein ACGFH8_17155 [Micromonospora sp. NPDC049175]|uniref:hypothetical protein n=1 Tax=Micromonospora sp. NPDC049175 TaxID=3364266 RepID=UPI0037154164
MGASSSCAQCARPAAVARAACRSRPAPRRPAPRRAAPPRPAPRRPARAYWPAENDDRYIDWSDFEYERGFDLEIGDGTTAVAVTLSMKQLRIWRDWLAADLAEAPPR